MNTSFVLCVVISSSTTIHLVWLQRYHWDWKYRIDKDSIKFLTFTVTVGLTTTIQSLHKTFLLMMMYQAIKFVCKRISSSADMIITVIPNCMSHYLTLKIANQSFIMILLPMMMHHHTRFSCKMLSCSKDVVQRNIESVNLCCDLDLEHSIAIFTKHSGLWWCTITLSLVAKGSAV